MPKKSIALNSFFNILYKGFTAFFPLLTTTYIARTLLPERIGLVSYTHVIVGYFTMMASLGIPSYGVKEISKCGDNLKERSKKFFELFTINGVSTAVWIILYYFFINLSPYFYDKRAVLNTMGLLLIFNFCNVDWFYQGIEEYKIIAIRGIIVKIASFLAMLIFVKDPDDYLIYALILCFATAGNYLYNIAILHRFIVFEKCQFQIKMHLRAVFVLLAAAIATEVYMALDTVMLEHFHGSACVAYYTNATKIVRMVYTLVIALITPLYPRIAYHLQYNERIQSDELVNKALKIVVLLGIPAMVGLFFMADKIVLILFGSEYVRSISVLQIASILVFVFSIAYILGHIILMSSGKEKYILRATIVGAVINAVLNYFLIPLFKENGAILASVVSEITVTSILIYYGSKNYSIEHKAWFYLNVGFASVIMMIVVLITWNITANLSNMLGVFITVAIGILAYFISLILFKNDLAMEFLEKIKQKI